MVSSATVIDKLSEQHRIARESAIAKLKEIESALRDAGDIDAMKVVQHAVRELQGDSDVRGRIKSPSQAAGGRLRQAAAAAGSSIQSATDVTTSALRSGAARTAENVAGATTAVAEKGGDLVRSSVAGVTAGLGVAHNALTGYAENLDWSNVDPSKYLDAGTHGISRGIEEARLVWESIPEQLRALGPEEVAARLDNFDWSHIVPFAKGGGSEAANGIFEQASLNRSRGAEQMTEAEIAAAHVVLADQGFQAAVSETVSQVFIGGVAAAVVGCVISSLEFGLEYQRGEITREEMYRRIGRAMVKSASVGATVAGVMAVVALAYPSVIPLAAPLLGPLAVLGFCVVGGKVVSLGKGWYELYQDVSSLRLSGVVPVATPPAP